MRSRFLFHFCHSHCLSKANLGHSFCVLSVFFFFTWILLSEGCSQKCCNLLILFDLSHTKLCEVVASTSKESPSCLPLPSSPSLPIPLDVCVQQSSVNPSPCPSWHCSSVPGFCLPGAQHSQLPLVSALGRLEGHMWCPWVLRTSGAPWKAINTCVYTLYFKILLVLRSLKLHLRINREGCKILYFLENTFTFQKQIEGEGETCPVTPVGANLVALMQ